MMHMEYRIADIDRSFDGRILQRMGGGSFVVGIDGKEHQLQILAMDPQGIEFVLDGRYHRVRYLERSTGEARLVVDNVPVTLNMHSHLDGIVFKNSGGAAGGAQLARKSQSPGKVVSVAVSEGDAVKKGDTVCTLESMKMQVAVKSHRDGTVKMIKVREAGTVAKGDTIAEIGE